MRDLANGEQDEHGDSAHCVLIITRLSHSYMEYMSPLDAWIREHKGMVYSRSGSLASATAECCPNEFGLIEWRSAIATKWISLTHSLSWLFGWLVGN